VQLKASFAFCVVQAQLYPDPVLLNLWYENYYTAPERHLQHTDDGRKTRRSRRGYLLEIYKSQCNSV
ncbi:hypothetical protein CGCVW01_v000891, partial [Colletotrichum viniferum]